MNTERRVTCGNQFGGDLTTPLWSRSCSAPVSAGIRTTQAYEIHAQVAATIRAHNPMG